MAYQSLYRRYRSGRFSELIGQDHVVTALKNAITEGRVGHAYLFSGPRGTGKTSTARILGKALNCTNLGADGEPCCECESCLSFAAGTSYDLQELDAASNNGVEAIRDLISRVALGSPGRTKVYILDEVHMLTSGAENALLKTLEEPPDHVVFVLATTEPHKVVPTIRSRTQHYEFRLIPAEQLEAHVRWVAADAGLDVSDEMIDYVVRAGGGSARDTLSALDQVVAAGSVPGVDQDAITGVLRGLADHDAAVVVSSVDAAIKSGRDPRVIGEIILARLRDAFLVSMAANVDHLSESQTALAAELSQRMGPAAITRALETVGSSLVDMRQAPDPRVDLEVALLRLSRPEIDTDMAAVVARLEQVERAISSGAQTEPSSPPPPTPSAASAAPSPPEQPAAAEPSGAPPAPTGGSAGPAAGAREALARRRESTEAESDPRRGAARTLGAHRGRAATEAPAAPPAAGSDAAEPSAESAPPPRQGSAEPAPPPAPVAGSPSLEAIEAAWPEVRATLSGRAKSRYSGGRFVSSGPDGVVFGLPNSIHRDRCADCIDEVRDALSSRFGVAINLELLVDDQQQDPSGSGRDPGPDPELHEPDDEVVDLSELTDARPDQSGGLDLLTEAFPGAEVIDP